MNIAQALQFGRAQLKASPTPEADSQLLLCHVLSCSVAYLHTWPDKILKTSEQARYRQWLQQRAAGQPVAYITGERGFWTLDLQVTPATLIPRPDTELLVSLALAQIQRGMRVADLGTGTGAVALALALEQPQVQVLAMDYSRAALDIARRNAQRYQLDNILFWQGCWLDAVQANSLDMIVTNPPYIARNDPHLEQGDLRFEPVSALVSGADGLDDIRQIIAQAVTVLRAGGILMIEHGYQQAAAIRALCRQAGFEHIVSHQDFGENDRVVTAQRPRF